MAERKRRVTSTAAPRTLPVSSHGSRDLPAAIKLDLLAYATLEDLGRLARADRAHNELVQRYLQHVRQLTVPTTVWPDGAAHYALSLAVSHCRSLYRLALSTPGLPQTDHNAGDGGGTLQPSQSLPWLADMIQRNSATLQHAELNPAHDPWRVAPVQLTAQVVQALAMCKQLATLCVNAVDAGPDDDSSSDDDDDVVLAAVADGKDAARGASKKAAWATIAANGRRCLERLEVQLLRPLFEFGQLRGYAASSCRFAMASVLTQEQRDPLRSLTLQAVPFGFAAILADGCAHARGWARELQHLAFATPPLLPGAATLFSARTDGQALAFVKTLSSCLPRLLRLEELRVLSLQVSGAEVHTQLWQLPGSCVRVSWDEALCVPKIAGAALRAMSFRADCGVSACACCADVLLGQPQLQQVGLHDLHWSGQDKVCRALLADDEGVGGAARLWPLLQSLEVSGCETELALEAAAARAGTLRHLSIDYMFDDRPPAAFRARPVVPCLQRLVHLEYLRLVSEDCFDDDSSDSDDEHDEQFNDDDEQGCRRALPEVVNLDACTTVALALSTHRHPWSLVRFPNAQALTVRSMGAARGRPETDLVAVRTIIDQCPRVQTLAVQFPPGCCAIRPLKRLPPIAVHPSWLQLPPSMPMLREVAIEGLQLDLLQFLGQANAQQLRVLRLQRALVLADHDSRPRPLFAERLPSLHTLECRGLVLPPEAVAHLANLSNSPLRRLTLVPHRQDKDRAARTLELVRPRPLLVIQTA